MNRLLRILSAVLAIALMVFVMVHMSTVANTRREGVVCSELEVVVRDSANLHFVGPADIERYLREDYGQWKGCKVDSIDLRKIESVLSERSAIVDPQAYVTVRRDTLERGVLHVEISQRVPVVLLKSPTGNFYADARGKLFEQKKDAFKDVPTIDVPFRMDSVPKAVPDPVKEEEDDDGQDRWEEEGDRDKAEWLRQPQPWVVGASQMIQFMEQDAFLRTAFPKIVSDQDGELTLTPKEGKERFLFGPPEDIQRKFARIDKYYRYIAPEREKDFYKVVDVRYEGQIICREK